MIPAGVISLWSGAIVNIPTGWVLCDGNNGTPDLRNNFVIGAGDTFAVDANGGGVDHTHPFVGDGHTHNLVGGANIQSGTGFHFVSAVGVSIGTTNNGGILPPYYALAYIMKT